MNPAIIKAIEHRRLLRFLYKGEMRWVEPHAYGSQPNGQDGICAWQCVGGSGEGYRNFLLREMASIAVGEKHFDGPRLDYRRGDQRFSVIYSEL